MTKQDNVYIRRCENYDRDKIRSIVEDGMNALNYNPFGNIFVKPNVVFSSRKGKYGKTAYTEPSLVGASLLALSSHPNVFRVDMGEKTAIGYPTRLTFKNAGYYNEMNHIRESSRAPVNLFCIDEEPRERVFVGGKIHDALRIARKMAQADSMVYLPKLKCHCVSTMTGAVKLNIGICSDDERAIRHDFLLNDKIVDLLAVGSPNFIVMDAIDVGVGNEAFPTPRKLGLVIMGTNHRYGFTGDIQTGRQKQNAKPDASWERKCFSGFLNALPVWRRLKTQSLLSWSLVMWMSPLMLAVRKLF